MAPFEVFRNLLQALKPTTNAKERNDLLKAESEELEMMADQLQDDLMDALMFYHKLTKCVGQESELKKRANVAIDRAKEALQVFEQHKKEGFEEGAKSVEMCRTRIQVCLLCLQTTQSSLARRTDYMRRALSDLARRANP
ncbi:hypothetical protein NCS57_01256600 [Fusarium keratoplasticum]|uniref:Uncharacterized protein n=1 Tax=Fusarium keratoplasticum TaxID=1328300 RepID=A0ACC0QIL7_9HYPO|nr:hypothetical protein NCS57_01256600 [Fusarium keratoplasticum]KAI8655089.1 hypothetical protein NCS57_01256600 [Fusarium keratoplasticum]